MEDLKELLLQGKNLIIAYELERAMIGVRVSAMHRVWKEIERELMENPNLFGNSQEPSCISESRIRSSIEETRISKGARWFGLYYSCPSKFENALLGVEASKNGFIVGVRYWGQESQYKEIQKKLEDMDGQSNDKWPWFHVVRPSGAGLKSDREDLVELLRLSDTAKPKHREDLAKCIRQNLEKILERLR